LLRGLFARGDLSPFIVPPSELEFGSYLSPYELVLARWWVLVLPLAPKDSPNVRFDEVKKIINA
jgi:hypothetical protein